MSEIQLDTADGGISARLRTPAGAGPWPGVVVVHDATGDNADFQQILERITAAGYLTLAPNLYSRTGGIMCVQRVFREQVRGKGRAFDDLQAARDHLQSRPDCTGKVAIVGFCLGGAFALLLAPKGFAASAPFYPPMQFGLEDALRGACPIVASLGSRDITGVGLEGRLRAAAAKDGFELDVKTYPGAGHSFANKLPAQTLVKIVGFGYNEDASEDAFRRVFAFFDTYLRAG